MKYGRTSGCPKANGRAASLKGKRHCDLGSKIRIGLEALLTDKTPHQIASEHRVPLAQVYTWKSAVRNHLPRMLYHQSLRHLDRRKLFVYLLGSASQSNELNWADLRRTAIGWMDVSGPACAALDQFLSTESTLRKGQG